MPSISPALSRTLALVTCTLLFAGLWSNDRPAVAMAMKTAPINPGVVECEAEWVPASIPLIADSSVASPHRHISDPPALEVQLGKTSKSFEVDRSGLLIADELLQHHLNQLPLGLAAGDYRIVDSLGGVGWLHVRIEGTDGNLPASPDSARLLSTTVDDGVLQFIRIATTSVSGTLDRSAR